MIEQTFTADDLERAWEMGRDDAAKRSKDVLLARSKGLSIRDAQAIHDSARALTPPPIWQRK